MLPVTADVCRRSFVGGGGSERFAVHPKLRSSGHPISGFKPATSVPVPATIQKLRSISVEKRRGGLAVEQSSTSGVEDDVDVHRAVAAPGMWTDRIGAEVERRFLGSDRFGVGDTRDSR